MPRKKKRAYRKKKQEIDPEFLKTPNQKKGEDGLTERQRRFVDEYLIDLNASKSATRAGYAQDHAGEQGYQLLQRTPIISAINKAIKERRDRLRMDADEVLRELARIARSDMLGYVSFGSDGVAVKESADLTEGEARALSEISETYNAQGMRQIKFKLHDKVKALELLAKHLRLYEEPSTKINVTWADLMNDVDADKEKRAREASRKIMDEEDTTKKED